MPRLGLLAVAALLAAGLGCSGEETRVVAKAPRPDSAVLAIVDDAGLVWLDPRTLQQLPLGSVPLQGGAWSPAFSLRGGMVALGGLGTEGVRIVDVTRMKLVGRVAQGSGDRSLVPLAWPDARRLFALEFDHMQGPGVPHVQDLLVVDPVAQRVVGRRPLGGWATGTARAGREVVLLVEPAEGIRPARLAVTGPDGEFRTVVLGGVLAGGREQSVQGAELRFHMENPGLAVDTRRWTVRTLEPRASLLLVADGFLFAAGAGRDRADHTETGMGLTAYTLDGSKLWHALGNEPVWWLQAAGGYAYVPAPDDHPRKLRVIDLASGRVVRAVPGDMPTLLVRDGGF